MPPPPLGPFGRTESHNSSESSTNELPLSEMIFSKNPSTPTPDLSTHAAINLDSLNFEHSHRMSPLATNELPLSCTCLRVPNSDKQLSGSSLPEENLLVVNTGDRIRRNSCSLDYGQSSTNTLNYSHRTEGNAIKVL